MSKAKKGKGPHFYFCPQMGFSRDDEPKAPSNFKIYKLPAHLREHVDDMAVRHAFDDDYPKSFLELIDREHVDWDQPTILGGDK